MESRRRSRRPLGCLVALVALGAGTWFGREHLPQEARRAVENVGTQLSELTSTYDPAQLQVGQRFVYSTGRPNSERLVEVTRLAGEQVDLYVSLRDAGVLEPDPQPRQSWTSSKTLAFLRGMGLGPMREETITVDGVAFSCQVYESPRVPFRAWVSDRFPGVVRLEKQGARLLDLRAIERVPVSERAEWAEPTGAWTVGF